MWTKVDGESQCAMVMVHLTTQSVDEIFETVDIAEDLTHWRDRVFEVVGCERLIYGDSDAR